MGFFFISQLGDFNEHRKHTFYENRPMMCFGYRKYTHLFWSTDKLDIYHVYIYEIYGFCMQNIVIEKKFHYQSHIKP